MKNLKYTTMAGRTLEVKFSEDVFFFLYETLWHCQFENSESSLFVHQ